MSVVNTVRSIKVKLRYQTLAAVIALLGLPRVALADDWTSHGLNASHQRLTSERSGAAFRGEHWMFALPATTATISSPAVADGELVFGALDGVIRALGATDGQLRWQVKLGDTVYAAPAIYRGKVFVPSLDNKLYALRLATGELAWRRDLGGLVQASPVVVEGGVIVAAGFPHRKIMKIDAATGEILWETPDDVLEQFSNAAAAVAGDQVIVGANGGHYYSFDLATGAVRWTYSVDGIVNLSAPVVVGDRAFMLPGGSSRKLHAVDLATGRPVVGWPIELPVTAGDVGGKLLTREYAVSSLAAIDSRIVFDLRIDDYLDTNKDAAPDRFLMREYVFAVDAISGSVLWQRPNGRAVIEDGNVVPKLWLCPTPAVYQGTTGSTADAALLAVSSTLDPTLRILDAATGTERWLTAAGPTQISPVLANGRLFFGGNGVLLGALSSTNQPPSAPIPVLTSGRAVTATAATLRWSPSLDPDGDGLTYQLRLDRDGELLESWEHEFTTALGQTTLRLPVPLEPGAVYTFAVRARDSKGAWSDWSTPAKFVATKSPSIDVGGLPQIDLGWALASAAPGSVVTLGAGTFNLSATLRVPGGVTLTGAGPSRTILRGEGLDVAVTLEGSAEQPSQLNNLTITGAAVGVAVRDTREAILKHLIIRDNTEAGVEVSSNARAQLINGTLLRNKNGVRSFGSLLVKNSVLAHSQTAFWSDSPATISSKFNDAYDNTITYRNVELGQGDFNAEVTWVDVVNNDFHARADQASTDRGDPDDDYRLEPAPNGGRINLGAYGGTAEAELSPEVIEPPAPPPPHHSGGCALAPAAQTPTGRDLVWLFAPALLAMARRRSSRRAGRAGIQLDQADL